mmetsp:Transcript_14404/g.40945  ORF Transcript_14404/g.40945 Transcript_14404/m.40945 type:complete len:352 (-) Transcript_14404:351-1406(-)
MRLEELEFLVRVDARILVVQSDDESRQHEIGLLMVNEGPAEGLVHDGGLQRKSDRVLHKTWLEMRGIRIDLPNLLDTQPVCLRMTVGMSIVIIATACPQIQLLHNVFRARSSGPFRKDGLSCHQFDTAFKCGFRFPILADTNISRCNSSHTSGLCGGFSVAVAIIVAVAVMVQNFRRRKARVDFHTQIFRSLRQPSADLTQTDDVVGVSIVQLRWHQEIGDCEFGGLRHEDFEFVVGDLGGHGLRRRRQFRQHDVVPIAGVSIAIVISGIRKFVREQFVQCLGIKYVAGQNVSANFGPLVDDANGEILVLLLAELLEADGGRQAGRSAADDEDVECHLVSRGVEDGIVFIG